MDSTVLIDRKSTRLNSSHLVISYAVFCLKKKKPNRSPTQLPRPAQSLVDSTPHERRDVSRLYSQFTVLGFDASVNLNSPSFFFFFNDRATTEIYPLPLHDALPISFLSVAAFALPAQQPIGQATGTKPPAI